MDNWVAEYNILLNGFSSSTNHGEWINNNYGHHRYQITRYNLFEGYSGSACMTGMIVANNNDNDYAKVYGNVFNNINACNGTVTGTSAGNLNYAEVYNNTFANSRTGVATLSGPGSGNVAYNNLLFNDLNYDGKLITSPNLANFSGSHNIVDNSNPFVDQSAGDFHLKAGSKPVNAGTDLTNDGYVNRDLDGNLRGADGTWDLGAYECLHSGGSTGDTTAPSNPTNFVASAVSSSQINLTWSASTDNVGVTGYRLDRCSGANCSNFTEIATPEAHRIPTPASPPGQPTATGCGPSTRRGTCHRTQASPVRRRKTKQPQTRMRLRPPPTFRPRWSRRPRSTCLGGFHRQRRRDRLQTRERCSGSNCSNFAQIGTPTGTSYSNTGLTAGTTYRYRVRAGDAAGNLSSYSSVASATAQQQQTPPSTASEETIWASRSTWLPAPTANRGLEHGVHPNG